MTLREVFAPHLGRHVKLGGMRPLTIERPHLRFAKYLRVTLPNPPISTDFNPGGGPAMTDVMLNDVLGDCGIAAGYHIVAVETGNAGNVFYATKDQIIADYSAIGSYRPGDPSTDNGIVLQDALNYWSTRGFQNGTKLEGWVSVDASNRTQVQQAVYLAENMYIGMCLPEPWVDPFPSSSGETWDVAGSPNQRNGHCVMIDGYDATGVWIITWGLRLKLTWAALARYAIRNAQGEAYVMFTPDQLAKGQTKAPNGIDWYTLLVDFDAMGAHIPLPTTPPAPPIDGKVTLALAQNWVASGIGTGTAILTRAGAVRLAQQGLANHWPKGA